ncbi:MAG TPA: DUF4058 family protein [Pirellulales bacterium]|nr:DUF4058 family protein [Pirellulales bacterium]
MRSPFPGMDPYIEALDLWEDFHHNFITEIQGAVSAVLPEKYVVRAGGRSYVVLSAHNGDDEFLTRPDETEYREGFLEIRELQPERKLVTCIEVLSPSNKRAGTPGWHQYLRKRQAYLEGAAHFVEIDLLRAGRRMHMHDDWPNSPNNLLVSRMHEAPHCTVWPAHYLRPLPPIPIPLAPPDPDISLALQPLIQSVYARSRHRLRQATRPARQSHQMTTRHPASLSLSLA